MMSILIDGAIYTVPLLLLGSRIDFRASCGVPLKQWLTGLLAIILLSQF